MSIQVLSRPNITLQEIAIPFNPNSSTDAVKYVTNTTGVIPLVVIKNVMISEENIEKLALFNNQIIPSIFIIFRDLSSQLIDSLFPLDNEIISIFIKATSEMNMPIRMDFKIMEFNPIKSGNEEKENISFTINGLLDVDELYYKNIKGYPGTSFNIFQNIASDCNLGFATNVTFTNDSMTWVNPGIELMNFIEDVTFHSYKDDSTFLWSYVDFYYNFNYVDIEKALGEDISKQVSANQFNVFTPNAQESVSPLVLTNHFSAKDSNVYINKYNLVNASTKINTTIGYSTTVIFYDKTENNINSTSLDTLSNDVDGTQIVLKDQPGSNQNFIQNVISHTYLGKLDQDNVHKNYLYAYQQNLNNLEFLQKLKMVITIKASMNFTLYRFQKVLVKLYQQTDPNRFDTEKAGPISSQEDAIQRDESKVNQRLSGEWLITGINYTFSNKFGNVQEVTLVKRELSATFNNQSS